MFSLAELKAITSNFSWSNLLGEGGFGPVYKGFIDKKLRSGLEAQPVAVKLLDLDGLQGHKEWLVSLSCCHWIKFCRDLKMEDEHSPAFNDIFINFSCRQR